MFLVDNYSHTLVWDPLLALYLVLEESDRVVRTDVEYNELVLPRILAVTLRIHAALFEWRDVQVKHTRVGRIGFPHHTQGGELMDFTG